MKKAIFLLILLTSIWLLFSPKVVTADIQVGGQCEVVRVDYGSQFRVDYESYEACIASKKFTQAECRATGGDCTTKGYCERDEIMAGSCSDVSGRCCKPFQVQTAAFKTDGTGCDDDSECRSGNCGPPLNCPTCYQEKICRSNTACNLCDDDSQCSSGKCVAMLNQSNVKKCVPEQFIGTPKEPYSCGLKLLGESCRTVEECVLGVCARNFRSNPSRVCTTTYEVDENAGPGAVPYKTRLYGVGDVCGTHEICATLYCDFSQSPNPKCAQRKFACDTCSEDFECYSSNCVQRPGRDEVCLGVNETDYSQCNVPEEPEDNRSLLQKGVGFVAGLPGDIFEGAMTLPLIGPETLSNTGKAAVSAAKGESGGASVASHLLGYSGQEAAISTLGLENAFGADDQFNSTGETVAAFSLGAAPALGSLQQCVSSTTYVSVTNNEIVHCADEYLRTVSQGAFFVSVAYNTGQLLSQSVVSNADDLAVSTVVSRTPATILPINPVREVLDPGFYIEPAAQRALTRPQVTTSQTDPTIDIESAAFLTSWGSGGLLNEDPNLLYVNPHCSFELQC